MSFAVPKRLVGNNAITKSANHGRPKTVYTLRITTPPDRKATHSDTSSGVLVCLVGESESSLVKYIPTTSSETSTETVLRDVCASGDIPPGADCSLIMGSPTPTESSYSKHRFLSGTTTEVSFVAPNLGPLSAVIVGPQSGTWGCSEVVVSSSADNGAMSSKFVSKEQSRILGEDPMYSASYMIRVPTGSIVYGEGPEAKILSASDAIEIAARNMTWYEEMKKRLLFYTATVGIVGTGLVYGSLGASASTAFAFGSIMSFSYQMGLQKRVDGIGSSDSGQQGPSFLTGVLPFFGVSALAWFVYAHPDLLGLRTSDLDIGGNDNFSTTMALLAGFGTLIVWVVVCVTPLCALDLLILPAQLFLQARKSWLSCYSALALGVLQEKGRPGRCRTERVFEGASDASDDSWYNQLLDIDLVPCVVKFGECGRGYILVRAMSTFVR